MTRHTSLLLLALSLAAAAPAPGRVPKVYNALITSNQNLEPSKAYPVYQPVLHDAFAFPYQPAVFYGDFPAGNGLIPVGPQAPKGTNMQPAPPPPPPQPEGPSNPKDVSPENLPPPPPPPPQPSTDTPDSEQKPTSAPPPPPNTQSPIPLNEFGLPSQVFPLGRVDPAFNGFTQVGPFTYTYPGYRFYDPYDPFSYTPYTNFSPFFRQLPNLINPVAARVNAAPAAVPPPSVPQAAAAPQPSGEEPPPEPSDLNVLNYASKDPAIPNVPPPPLPQGGLRAEDSE